MNDDKLWDICLDIYQEMYGKSTPSADFKRLRAIGVTAKTGWFHDYHLSMTEQEAIIEKHLERHKLTSRDRKRIRTSVHLGCSPCSCDGKNPDHRKSPSRQVKQ